MCLYSSNSSTTFFCVLFVIFAIFLRDRVGASTKRSWELGPFFEGEPHAAIHACKECEFYCMDTCEFYCTGGKPYQCIVMCVLQAHGHKLSLEPKFQRMDTYQCIVICVWQAVHVVLYSEVVCEFYAPFQCIVICMLQAIHVVLYSVVWLQFN